MSPDIVLDDLLLVDRSLRPVSDNIVLAVVNGEFTVKRLIIRNKKHFLVPQNSKYSTLEIKEEMEFCVWGVISYVIRSV